MIYKLRLFFVFITCFIAVHASSQTKVTDLVCEYMHNPIGIDIEKPRLSWKLISDKRNISQEAYEIKVAYSEKDLKANKNLLWHSGKIKSASSIHVQYQGQPISSFKKVYWTVRVWDNKGKLSSWSEPSTWETGVMDDEQWDRASWISVYNEGKITSSLPSQYYRYDFNIEKEVKQARVYITSLGTYKLFLNGSKVSDYIFGPGWTSYHKRLQYQTYDVTEMLDKDNAVGVMIGDGWYRGRMGWQNDRAYYGNRLGLLFMMRLRFSDGTEKWITSNKDWKWSYGPIVWSDHYDGECYDLNKELTGWNLADYNDGEWHKVELLDVTKDNLVANVNELPKIIKELKPIDVFTSPKGELIADLGQNIVGYVRLKVKGFPGDTITIKYAEVLDRDGNFYTKNLRSAKATDYLILKDESEVVYEPNFTFHGFRYVHLRGLRNPLSKDDMTGLAIHSPMRETGLFECSDSLLNRLQKNIEWGQRDNFLDVPTDCPQRDERLGWTGDAQVFSMTAAYNFDVATFYTKWLKDLAADQLEDGRVPVVIPNVVPKLKGSAAWADAVIIVPWTMYRVYGDIRILEEQYDSMVKWVEYMAKKAGKSYLWRNDFHWGDWLAYSSTKSDYPGATTEKDLIANSYFRYSSMLLSKIASIIGKNEDSRKWAELSENVKSAFIKEFVTPNGRLVSHTQTAYLLALSFDMLPDTLKPKAANYLAQDVVKFKHLTTGFVGTPLLCNVLSDIGRDDLAFMLLMRKEYPSWLYPVTKGATTIWERWNCILPDGSFHPMGMNSFNHYAYGAIGEWMYSYIGGIKSNPEYPAYKYFTLSPHVGGGLTYAKGELITMYGKILSSWNIANGIFNYELEIPCNTSAKVVLPNAQVADVLIDNKALVNNKSLDFKAEGKNVIIELGSGKYKIQYKYNN